MLSIDYKALEDLKVITAFLEFVKDPTKYAEIAKTGKAVLAEIDVKLGMVNTVEKAEQEANRLHGQASKILDEAQKVRTTVDTAMSEYKAKRELDEAEYSKRLVKLTEERRMLAEQKKQVETSQQTLKLLADSLSVSEAALSKRSAELVVQARDLGEKSAKLKQILG